MRIKDAKVVGVEYTAQFMGDLLCLPDKAMIRTTNLLKTIEETQVLPNSLKPHTSWEGSPWIGWVNQKPPYWRLLFEVEQVTPNEIYMVVLRVVKHDDVSKALERLNHVV